MCLLPVGMYRCVQPGAPDLVRCLWSVGTSNWLFWNRLNVAFFDFFSVFKLPWPISSMLSLNDVMGSAKRRLTLVLNSQSPSLFLFITRNEFL